MQNIPFSVGFLFERACIAFGLRTQKSFDKTISEYTTVLSLLRRGFAVFFRYNSITKFYNKSLFFKYLNKISVLILGVNILSSSQSTKKRFC